MKKRVIQRHHICYDPEIVVPIYKGEHFILTQMQRRKYFSKGFVRSIRTMLKEIVPKAVKLKMPVKKKGKRKRR
tara:strand:- start:576 stop:797 length:222 start_codon:yes stop_codon:yes gene_type:complete